ncbi:MAG: CbbQ/NirQ/NorQ/GpvN family protein [Pseudomonadota bacterium]
MDPLAPWRLEAAPHYHPVGGHEAGFMAAASVRIPILLTGPTGCGKTRFVESMAWRLGRPLVTVACHEDLSAGDLAGRWLLDGGATRWQDGPLTLAARHGGICYLDEMIEARSDVLVVIHPLADSRRVLPLERHGELVRAHPDFLLVASYNPGYRGLHKSLKPSTRQRFTGLAFDYPAPAVEAAIVSVEGGVEFSVAERLVALAIRTRRLKEDGIDEGTSTRLLVHAAQLHRAGLPLRDACRQALAAPLTDDAELSAVLTGLIDAAFE